MVNLTLFSFFFVRVMCSASVLLDDRNLPTTSCRVHMYKSNLKYDDLPISHNPSAMQSIPYSKQCNQTPAINRS
ncbi:hypothetical protein J3E68DRAFT_92477 [Trichoderma sp. SZMC 28012]